MRLIVGMEIIFDVLQSCVGYVMWRFHIFLGIPGSLGPVASCSNSQPTTGIPQILTSQPSPLVDEKCWHISHWNASYPCTQLLLNQSHLSKRYWWMRLVEDAPQKNFLPASTTMMHLPASMAWSLSRGPSSTSSIAEGQQTRFFAGFPSVEAGPFPCPCQVNWDYNQFGVI